MKIKQSLILCSMPKWCALIFRDGNTHPMNSTRAVRGATISQYFAPLRDCCSRVKTFSRVHRVASRFLREACHNGLPNISTDTANTLGYLVVCTYIPSNQHLPPLLAIFLPQLIRRETGHFMREWLPWPDTGGLCPWYLFGHFSSARFSPAGSVREGWVSGHDGNRMWLIY